MPLPKPKPREKQGDFHSRCMEFVHGEDKSLSKDKANAMCFAAWKNRSESVDEALPQQRGYGYSPPAVEPPRPREKQYEFIPRCIKEVQGNNSTITDEEAGAICFMAWQCRYESMHPADANLPEVSTADWSKVDKTRLPMECFLLVPNPDNPKTWQAPVYEGAGPIDPKTRRFREKGLLNLQALRMEAARKKLPGSVKARIKTLLSQCELSEQRYETYHTPDLQESGEKPAHLVEAISFCGAEFVEEAGRRIVKNVVMLGPVSSHGYGYKQEAMSKAVKAGMYEGVRIFINHSKEGRDLMHLAGVFREARHEDGKVKGNAHLLDDAYGKKFWDIAKNMPEAAGCSHVADGRLVKSAEGKQDVEEITKVYSVDLVVQGATTKNVFEGEAPDKQGKDSSMELEKVSLADLKTARPDLARQLVQEGAASRDEEVQALIQEKQALSTEKETLAKDKTSLAEENKQLQAKIAEQTVRETTRQKEAIVAKVVATLPEHARTEGIKKMCLNATTGKDGFDEALFEAAVTEIVKPIKDVCEQTGVKHQGGEQNREAKGKTPAEIAEAALAEGK